MSAEMATFTSHGPFEGSKKSLLDHLVGAGQHGCGDFDAERLGRLQVDDELESGRQTGPASRPVSRR